MRSPCPAADKAPLHISPAASSTSAPIYASHTRAAPSSSSCAFPADKARLRVAPWDGYLKYYNLGDKVRLCCFGCCNGLLGSD